MFEIDFAAADPTLGIENGRYLIEPRSKNTGTYSSVSWLVVYDTVTEKYLTKGGKTYLRFSNSKAIVDYLRSLKTDSTGSTGSTEKE